MRSVIWLPVFTPILPYLGLFFFQFRGRMVATFQSGEKHMRTSMFLRGSGGLLVAILPLVLHAQFQEPTQDELKMTADPAAPGAAAVYLYYEEIDNDPIHYKSIYARIKVLTDKGKDLATVDLPYESSVFKIRAIEGRTIHPDGTEYKLTTKPEDLMTSKSGNEEVARKVFTLPNVTVGSI